jgi:hypothetical protein
MGRRLLLINIAILVGIGLLARHVTTNWQSFQTEHDIEKIVERVQPGKVIPVDEPSPAEPPQPFGVFADIPAKDLFAPDRRPQPEGPVVAETPPPLPRNPSLNGILNNEGKKQALLTVYDAPNNPRGRSRVVSVGDNVQGYTVTEIGDTSMKMRWKEVEIVVDMFDDAPKQPSPGPPKTIAVVTVVTIGSPAPAVETSSADAGGPEERRGVEAGVSAVQTAQRAGQASRTTAPGAPGRSPNTVRPADLPGTLGVPGGSVPFTSRTRRDNR